MYYGERLNSISHLVGAVFALIAFGALLAQAIPTRDPRIIVGFTTFGLTLVLLYTMSTLYHSFQGPRLKKLFKLLDHISIYLLLAGRRLLADIEKRGAAILDQPPRLGLLSRLGLLLRARLGGRT